jgi:hypothetical protein
MKIEDSQDKNIVLKMNFGIRLKRLGLLTPILNDAIEFLKKTCLYRTYVK